MTKVSVEYAHIYTNSHINDEHEKSLSILNEVKLAHTDANLNLVVMVDDYSFPDPTFNYNEFVDWLDRNGHKPDLMIRESQLMPLCDQVVEIIGDEKLKASIIDYIKAKKYPCSLFIAAWYLARLGYIQSDIIPNELVSDSLINILPESFKPFEDKGLEIIMSTPHSEAANMITYEFIEGRLLA